DRALGPGPSARRRALRSLDLRDPRMPDGKVSKGKSKGRRGDSGNQPSGEVRNDSKRSKSSQPGRGSRRAGEEAGRSLRRLLTAAETAINQHEAPHVFSALRYIRSVLDGEIPSCKWVRLACERQLLDLEKSSGESFPFRFDLAAAERVCRFVELSPHVKGKK